MLYNNNKKKSGLISAVIFKRKSYSDLLLDNMILLDIETRAKEAKDNKFDPDRVRVGKGLCRFW